MAEREQVALAEKGVTAWNRWRSEHPGARPDLAKAHLVHKKLKGADLYAADLTGADLSGTDLTGADLRRANLAEAKMGGCTLKKALLLRANLAGANLRGADLTQADLREAVLKEADLQKADLTGTRLWGAYRDGWKLAGVRCDHVYLDPEARLRVPRKGAFEEGEFERRYRVSPAFTLGMKAPLDAEDYALLERRLAELNKQHPDWGLKLALIDMHGTDARVRFEVSVEKHVDAARAALTDAVE
jgi:hypothetical protein